MEHYRQIKQNTDAKGHEKLAEEMASKNQTRLNLDVSRSVIKDLSFLGAYSNLTHIFIVGAKRGLQYLADLPNLEKIGLSQCKVDSLDCLARLDNLVELDLLLGSISDYESIKHISGLKSFTAMKSRSLRDISFLSRLEELQSFKLDQCSRVANIPDLSGNKKLQRVHLEGLKGLSSIDSVASAPNLETLIVIDCKLEPQDFQIFVAHPNKPIVLPGIAPIGSKKGNEVDNLLGSQLMVGFYGTENENFEIR